MENKNIYVGHRYVPKIMGEHDSTQSYEGLSIVTHEGASYTSKKYVPIGVEINNEEYWVITGNYNAQLEHYRSEVSELNKKVNKDLTNVKNLMENSIVDTGYGIVYGGKVIKNTPSKMSVIVEELKVYTKKGKVVNINDTILQISNAHETLRRRDLIYIDNDGEIKVEEGTPSYEGTPPETKGIPLAIVTIKEGVTTIESNQILDIREYRLSSNELSEEIQVAKFSNARSNRVSDGIISEMLDIAQGYVSKRSLFNYGAKDAFYNINGQIYKQNNGSYEMTCSTFCHLLAKGISFENSRYNGKRNNIVNPNFNNDYEVYEGFVTFRWAEWAYNNGFMFKPKEDLSDLQAGDMLMLRFRKPEHQLVNRDSAFKLIEHSAMFVEKRKHGLMVYEQGSDDGPVFRTYTPELLQDTFELAYVIRLPYSHVNMDIKNLLIGSGEKKEIRGKSLIGSYPLNQPLKRNKWYTVTVKGKLLTEGTYLSFYNGSNLIYSGSNNLPSENEYHTYHFNTGDTILPNEEFRVLLVDSDGTIPVENRNADIDWVVLSEGFLNNITDYIDGGKKREVTFTFKNEFEGFSNIYYSNDFCLINIHLSNPTKITSTNIGDIGEIKGINIKSNIDIPCEIRESLSLQPSYSQNGVAWVDGNSKNLRYRRTDNENLTKVNFSIILPY